MAGGGQGYGAVAVVAVPVFVCCAGDRVDVAADGLLVVWVNAQASFVEFGDEAGGELDGVEEGVGNRVLDAVIGQRLDDLVEGGKDGGLVEEGREDERLRFWGFFSGWFGRALGVVVAAEFRAVDGECAASLAVFEGLRASRCHVFSLKISEQWAVRLCLFRVPVVTLLASQRRFSTPRTKTCPWGPRSRRSKSAS